MKNRYFLTISAFTIVGCSMFNQQTLTLQVSERTTEVREVAPSGRTIASPSERITGEVMDTDRDTQGTTKIVSEKTVKEHYDRPYRDDDDTYVVRRRYVRPSSYRRSYYSRPYRRSYSRPYRRYYNGRSRRYYDDGYYYGDRGSNVLGGAATGALIGGAAGGGRGAAIGAGVGAGLGLIGP